MDFLIKELVGFEAETEDEICRLLRQNADPELSCYFIYNDRNFKKYFKSLLNSPSDRFFYCTDPSTGKCVAFAHMKFAGPVIRLNNLVIEKACEKSTLGTQLMERVLETALSEEAEFERFELDVFEKNKKAFNFYLQLGMEISDYSYWYDITSFCANAEIVPLADYSLNSASFTVAVDENGFNQLFYNETLIGTIIDGKCLLVRTKLDYVLLKKLNLFFRSAGLSSACLVSKKELELSLIDKAFHLTIPFEKLNLLNQPE